MAKMKANVFHGKNNIRVEAKLHKCLRKSRKEDLSDFCALFIL
jgi:hypothetical protein